MKRAIALPMYRDPAPFEPPPGLVSETIDPQSGQLATVSCPRTAQEYFVAGSEPTQYCELHGGQLSQAAPGAWLARLFGRDANPSPPAPVPDRSARAPTVYPRATPGSRPGSPPAPRPSEQPQKKKGLLDRIFGIFGGSKRPADNSKPQP